MTSARRTLLSWLPGTILNAPRSGLEAVSWTVKWKPGQVRGVAPRPQSMCQGRLVGPSSAVGRLSAAKVPSARPGLVGAAGPHDTPYLGDLLGGEHPTDVSPPVTLHEGGEVGVGVSVGAGAIGARSPQSKERLASSRSMSAGSCTGRPWYSAIKAGLVIHPHGDRVQPDGVTTGEEPPPPTLRRTVMRRPKALEGKPLAVADHGHTPTSRRA